MCEMLDRLGLDASCGADQVCKDWLVCVDKAPAFCPNAKLFASARDLINRPDDGA
jgi:hypothetical protein